MPVVPQPDSCPACGSDDVRRSGVRVTSPALAGAARRVAVTPTTSWRWICGSCGRMLGTAPPARP